ncbi:MAG: PHP domain-containing protein [Actinobacteria bacterium]|nr:PHP domain-containing protein [Actinomycetota bacterium]
MTGKAFFLESARLGIEAACITNHGNLTDYEDMAREAPSALRLIPGVEAFSPAGDFLIYSADLGFLRGLEAVQSLPERDRRPESTAVVWAHPFAGNPGGADASEDYLGQVASQVDGIEVYNGNWFDEAASALARRIAAEFGLAQLGGSDAHSIEQLMRCWTEVGKELHSAENFIEAILERKTGAKKL